MPKKKNPLTPEQQRRLFEAEVQRRIDAGELSAIEAESFLDRLVVAQRKGDSHKPK